jgi:predicted DNA-binding transcriptional regulator AlpA
MGFGARVTRYRVSDDPNYLSAGQVKRRFGDKSDMWIWRYIRQHGFPQPVRFGGPKSARHWRLSEIEEWERSRTLTQRRTDQHDTQNLNLQNGLSVRPVTSSDSRVS